MSLQSLPDQAKEGGATLEALCQNPNVKKIILQDILKYGTSKGLKSFEQVRLTNEKDEILLNT